MKLNSLKALSLYLFIVLLAVFTVQLPIVYRAISGMVSGFDVASRVEEMNSLAIEVPYTLNRHIMNGDEMLEKVFVEKVKEFDAIVASLKTSNDNDISVLLGDVEKKWLSLKTRINEAMEHGGAARINKTKVESWTYVTIESINELIKTFEALDQSYSKSVNIAARQRMLTYKLDYLVQRYFLESGDVGEAVRNELKETIKLYENSISDLKNGSSALGLKPVKDPAVLGRLEKVRLLWNERKQTIEEATNSIGGYRSAQASFEKTETPALSNVVQALKKSVAERIEKRKRDALGFMIASLAVITAVILVAFLLTNKLTIRPIEKATAAVERFAQGDLTKKVDVKVSLMGKEIKNEVGRLVESVNALATNMSSVIENIVESSTTLASASEQLSSSATQIASGGEEQAGRATHVSTASHEMSATIIDVAKNASNAAESAETASRTASMGGQVVSKTIESMNGIATTAKETSDVIAALGERSTEIGKIVSVIDDIADQTNLLALNAAIEAARAGEQGRGFAVVADEVRKLAERTSKATKEIGIMIKSIQEETEKAIATMDKEVKVVEQGVTLAKEAGSALGDIVGQVEAVTSMIRQIAVASEEQATTSDQISKDIEAVASITKQSTSGAQEIAHASHEMASMAAKLKSVVAMFKVGAHGEEV
ncbi:MAG: type IV pili methyl-accepting chemotaxis transducer N-terminal domain-containing protein [Deltaproteobacteria bacterium]|nr:type IV pili methyl-accepting chemotaxis transducer N-terminal domain-containing protein [Deltaproteobacteria bacterium]